MAQMNTLTVNGETYEVVDSTARANAATVQSNLDTHGANKSNPHGVTYSQVGAAPDGYGLGTTAKSVAFSSLSEFDNLTTNGWYWLSTSSAITLAGFEFTSCQMEVSAMVSGYIWQTIRFVGITATLRRSKNSAGWSEWDWDNPPMVTGVEYRTTERVNGSVVYKKQIYFGGLPQNASASIAHGITNIEYCHDVQLFANGNNVMSFNSAITKLVVDATNVTITTNSSVSVWPFIILSYTKTS